MTATEQAIPLPIGQAETTSGVDKFLMRLVAETIREYNAEPLAGERSNAARKSVTAPGRGKRIVDLSAVRSALYGGAVGLVTTGGAMLATGTQGIGGLVGAPISAVTIAAETVLRVRIHVRMACRLADLFDVRFDPEDPFDVFATLALTRGRVENPSEEEEDPARSLTRLANADLGDFAKGLGARLFGEGVLRSFLPFVGVVSSALTNFMFTQRLGHVVLRYARYRRALADALDDTRLAPFRAELVEGLWFLFAADGRLLPEETAMLAAALRGADSSVVEGLSERLADPIGWYLRLKGVSEEARLPLYHALEIGAAVDERVSLRERALLERAAEALGATYDEDRLTRMIHEIGTAGVPFEQIPEEKARPYAEAA